MSPPAAAKCPKCRGDLAEIMYAGVTVDRCESCQGLWFDALELDALVAAKGSETIDTGDATLGRNHNTNDRIKCPRCEVQMLRMVDAGQPHIWFEQCAACGGSFFDAGEFRDLKQHTLSDWFKRLFPKPRL